MADIEKVIKGFECCKACTNEEPFAKCDDCPYNEVSVSVQECRGVLSSDVLELLKKYKPKKKESRAKLQCLCGRKRLETWCIASGGEEIRCPGCGLSASGKSEIEAIRAWNKMIVDARSHLQVPREEER